MAVQVPRLKRGLFGYRPKIVRSILTGREIMFTRVWQRLQRTEAECDQIRADLEACRAEIDVKTERARLAEEQSIRHAEQAASARAEAAELRTVNESLRGRIYSLEAKSAGERTPTAEAASVPENLAMILGSAEDTFTRLVEGARQRNEEQLRDVEVARRALQVETARLEAWRADVERRVASVSGAVADVRAHIRATPERLRAALLPTTDAIVSVDAALDEVAEAARRLPEASEPAETPALTVHIPEASNGAPNGSASTEDLAAIQELYGSR